MMMRRYDDTIYLWLHTDLLLTIDAKKLDVKNDFYIFDTCFWTFLIFERFLIFPVAFFLLYQTYIYAFNSTLQYLYQYSITNCCANNWPDCLVAADICAVSQLLYRYTSIGW